MVTAAGSAPGRWGRGGMGVIWQHVVCSVRSVTLVREVLLPIHTVCCYWLGGVLLHAGIPRRVPWHRAWGGLAVWVGGGVGSVPALMSERARVVAREAERVENLGDGLQLVAGRRCAQFHVLLLRLRRRRLKRRS